MDFYSAYVINRLEHREKMRTAARIRAHRIVRIRQSRWMSRRLHSLLNVAGIGLIRVGKRMMTAEEIAVSLPYPDPKGQQLS